MRRLALILAVLLCSLWVAEAQDAVPAEILNRTIFIKVGNESGTAFTVDYQGKMFLITARHVVAGVAKEGAVIQIMKDQKWVDYPTTKTIYPSSDDVDIAVFETSEKVPTPYGIGPADSVSGPTMGQQVWFLGYPFGIASRFQGGIVAPFIKRGTMSAIDANDPKAVVLYIDGFNNPGFSGGPIIYWDFSAHAYRILGVVKGYREDSAKVIINGQHVDTQLLVNTGILVGYSIGHAMEAIKDSSK